MAVEIFRERQQYGTNSSTFASKSINKKQKQNKVTVKKERNRQTKEKKRKRNKRKKERAPNGDSSQYLKGGRQLQRQSQVIPNKVLYSCSYMIPYR